MGETGNDLNVMAIDPGATTGLAFVEIKLYWDRAEVVSMDVREAFSVNEIGQFVGLLGATCEKILIERSPAVMGDPKQALFFNNVIQSILQMSNDVKGRLYIISPGNWKYVSAKRGWTSPRGSQHSKDAIGMVRYYIWETYQKDLIMRQEEK